MNNSSTLEKIPYRGLSFTLWSPRQRSLLVSIMKETPAAYECANCRETFAAPDRGKRLMWKALDREKKAAFERAGLSKLCNVLRHSFCSYHVALHQDAAKTALLMQHTNQAMLYRHYKGLALRADAERYFSIKP